MSRNIESRVARLEAATNTGRMHVIWAGGKTEAEIDADRVRRSVLPGDTVLLVQWQQLGTPAGL